MGTIDLRSKYDELEIQRLLHVTGLDMAIGAIEKLKVLDHHLVDQGFHEELQLADVDLTVDRPAVQVIPADGVHDYLGITGGTSTHGSGPAMQVDLPAVPAQDAPTPPPRNRRRHAGR
jgi:hypothetical protein